MKNDKQAAFDQWVQRLEARCNFPSLRLTVDCSSDFERPLTEEEHRIIRANIKSYETQFRGKKLCSACRYPLEDDAGFCTAEYGPCCWLCHIMDNALRQTTRGHFFGTVFEWFNTAHKQWQADEEKAKKIKDHEDGKIW